MVSQFRRDKKNIKDIGVNQSNCDAPRILLVARLAGTMTAVDINFNVACFPDKSDSNSPTQEELKDW